MDNNVNKYGGMTVNERLYVSGMMNKFDKAIDEKNIKEVVRILKEVEISSEANIAAILKKHDLIK